MGKIRRGRHYIFNSYIHLVFITKYRRKDFNAAGLDEMKTIFQKVRQNDEALLRRVWRQNCCAKIFKFRIDLTGKRSCGHQVILPLWAAMPRFRLSGNRSKNDKHQTNRFWPIFSVSPLTWLNRKSQTKMHCCIIYLKGKVSCSTTYNKIVDIKGSRKTNCANNRKIKIGRPWVEIAWFPPRKAPVPVRK